MEVIEYLKSKSLEELKGEHGINHRLYDDFVILNYDMLESPRQNEIVKECRTLILNKAMDKVCARTFDRFFNYNEFNTINLINVKRALFLEKLDGSLCYIWRNSVDDRWEIGTRTQIFAESVINGTTTTFRNAIIKALKFNSEDQFQDHFNKLLDIYPQLKDMTIICEFTSLENRIVTTYETPRISLIGIRNIVTGEDYPWAEVEDIFYSIFLDIDDRIDIPKKYSFDSIEQVIDYFKTQPLDFEGFVVRYGDIRVKIKNPNYLQLHHLCNNGVITNTRILDMMKNGDIQEFINYFPVYKNDVDNVLKLKEELFNKIDELWDKYKCIEDRKEFALEIQSLDPRYKTILFNIKNGKTMHEVWDSRPADDQLYFLSII